MLRLLLVVGSQNSREQGPVGYPIRVAPALLTDTTDLTLSVEPFFIYFLAGGSSAIGGNVVKLSVCYSTLLYA